MVRAVPGLTAVLNAVTRVDLLIDAKVVLAEIRFRLKRQKPEARSYLGEAIDSGMVVFFAPENLLSRG